MKMRTLTFALAATLVSHPFAALRAEAGPPIQVDYDCKALSFSGHLESFFSPAGGAFRNLKERGHFADFQLRYRTGANVGVASARFSYQDVRGGRAVASLGAWVVRPNEAFKTRLVENAADSVWIKDAVKGSAVLYAERVGPAKFGRPNEAYSYNTLAFVLPERFLITPIREPFSADVHLAFSEGGPAGPNALWKKVYRAWCVAREQPDERETYEYVDGHIVVKKVSALSRVESPEELLASERNQPSEQAKDNGADEFAPSFEAAAESRSRLRERLPELSAEHLDAAVGLTLTTLLAQEAVKNSPQMLSAVRGATASALSRLAARQAGAGIARSLAARLGESMLSWRALGVAASGLVSAASVGMVVDSSAPQAAEAGGPGYFLTAAGTRKIVLGSEENFRLFAAHDPLVQAYLVKLAEKIETGDAPRE